MWRAFRSYHNLQLQAFVRPTNLRYTPGFANRSMAWIRTKSLAQYYPCVRADYPMPKSHNCIPMRTSRVLPLLQHFLAPTLLNATTTWHQKFSVQTHLSACAAQSPTLLNGQHCLMVNYCAVPACIWLSSSIWLSRSMTAGHRTKRPDFSDRCQETGAMPSRPGRQAPCQAGRGDTCRAKIAGGIGGVPRGAAAPAKEPSAPVLIASMSGDAETSGRITSNISEPV